MMKERLTITLDQEILKKIDESIDGVNIRNRSHAIEKILDAALLESVPNRAVILAGGKLVKSRGEGEIPRCMIRIKGKPILEYVINELKRNSITNIIVSVSLGGERIMRHFGEGTSLGVKINYTVEESPKGTEGALSLVKGFISGSSFFTVYGDNLFRLNLSEMYKQHVTTKSLATVALTTIGSTGGFGVTRLDGFKIVNFVEKPSSDTKSKLVSSGIFLFDFSVLNMLSAERGQVSLERSLFPKLANSGKLYGYVFSGPWEPLDLKDVDGSIKRLEEFVEFYH